MTPKGPRVVPKIRVVQTGAQWLLDWEKNHSEAGDHGAEHADDCQVCADAARLAYSGERVPEKDKRSFYAFQLGGITGWVRKSAVTES